MKNIENEEMGYPPDEAVSHKNEEVEYPVDNDISQKDDQQDFSQNVLKGYSLLDLGLSIDLESLKSFKDPNYETGYYVVSYSLFHPNKNFYFSGLERFENISVLMIDYCEDRISMSYMPALYLQGYKKSVDTGKEQFIEVDSKLYSLAELNQYKLYDDDQFIVLDITDLLPVESFDEKIEMRSEHGMSNYSYDWMNDVYEYLKSYEDIIISRPEHQQNSEVK